MTAPPPSTGPAGVYVHVPFCERHCTFCDFPTVIGREERIEPYLDALVAEIAAGQTALPREADTIYVGGGTPSRLAPQQLRRVLDAVRARFAVAAGAEVTVECNPESLDAAKLAGYADAGVTRISLGIQTLSDEVLRATGRLHDRARSLAALRAAKACGAFAVSVDLMAGLPGDPPESWLATLDAVLDEVPDHVSVYLLEIDKPTPLARALRDGRVRVPGGRALASLYARAAARLEAGGWAQYEIASFARPGRRCRHNRKYWTECWYGGSGSAPTPTPPGSGGRTSTASSRTSPPSGRGAIRRPGSSAGTRGTASRTR